MSSPAAAVAARLVLDLDVFRTWIAAAAAAVLLVSCGDGESIRQGGRGTVAFAILSDETPASISQWQPLLDDMEAEIGVEVEPFFAPTYRALIEAMDADQVQVGWFPAAPALRAIDRARGEMMARTVDLEGRDSYTSTLIVRAGSGITLEQVLACDGTLDFGLGDAQSTSGTLAPMTFLFGPRGIDPGECFRTVRSASHQANALSIATGELDVATSNSVNAGFVERQNPDIAVRIEEIWESPPLPEAGIVVRGDLDPSLKERIRSFLLTYGQGEGPEAERQRRVLAGLDHSAFRAADSGYLDPVREMRADQALREARAAGDAEAAARAEAELERLRTAREVQP